MTPNPFTTRIQDGNLLHAGKTSVQYILEEVIRESLQREFGVADAGS